MRGGERGGGGSSPGSDVPRAGDWHGSNWRIDILWRPGRTGTRRVRVELFLAPAPAPAPAPALKELVIILLILIFCVSTLRVDGRTDRTYKIKMIVGCILARVGVCILARHVLIIFTKFTPA